MKEKPVKTALDNIARRQTAHHADLWDRLAPQIRTEDAPRPRLRRVRMRWATAISLSIVFLLVVGAGAYAMQQWVHWIPDFDRGLQRAYEQQTGTELSASLTLDGVTVTLDWAYADAHRVAVFYSVNHAQSPYIPVKADVEVEAELPDGTRLPVIYGGGGGGGGGGSGGGGGDQHDATQELLTSWALEGSVNFRTASVADDLEDLALRLRVRVRLDVVPVGREAAPTAQAPESLLLGPFDFEIELPVIPAILLTPQASQTVSDVTVHLKQVSITPSSTTVTLCMGGVPPDRAWLPDARLEFGEGVQPEPGFTDMAPEVYSLDGQPCADLDFLVPYAGKPDQWTLVVERLATVQEGEVAMLEVSGPWTFELAVP